MALLTNSFALIRNDPFRNLSALVGNDPLTNVAAASADTYLMSRQHILWPSFATARSAGISYLGDASSMFGGYETSDGTVGRYWEWSDCVLLGDYTIRILCYAAANYGKFHVSFNGADTGARIDCNVAGGYNQVLSATFPVATKTRGPLRLSIDSKTGSTYYGVLAQVALAKTSTGDDEGESVDDLPWVVDVPLMSYSATSAGWARANSTTYPGGGTTLYSDSANGRWIDYLVWIPAGTWSFSAIHFRNSSQGILEVSLDSSAVGTIDCYGSFSQLVGTISSITVPETKIYTVRLATNGKNASASSYGMQLNALQFRRTE